MSTLLEECTERKLEKNSAVSVASIGRLMNQILNPGKQSRSGPSEWDLWPESSKKEKQQERKVAWIERKSGLDRTKKWPGSN